MWLRTSNRLLKQELGRGELQIMVLAIALAVLAVYSLSGFSSRIQETLVSRSSGFLAADRVLRSAHAIDPRFYEAAFVAAQASDPSLRQAELLEFQTMAYAGEAFVLASVKAIRGPYPLRGELKIADGDALSSQQGSPEAGTVWLDERAMSALGIGLGHELEIGHSRFRVSAEIVAEPDASFNVFRAGPRIMMNRADIPATGVVQPGSRLTYKLLFAAEGAGVEELGRELSPLLSENQEWYGVQDGESPLARSLDRANKFLLLASLLGVILAATAIAVAARRYTERHFDPVAVFKTLGMRRREISLLYAYQLLVITTAGILLGLVGGYVLQEGAITLIGDRLGSEVPPASGEAAWLALVTGAICALLFSLTPMLRLARISAMRVIRRDLDLAGQMQWLSVLLTGVSLFILIWLFSQDWQLSASLFFAVALCGGIMLFLSRGLLWLARRWGAGQGALGMGLAGLYRRAHSNAIQILSFAIGIMLLITIVVLRHEMIDEWQQQLPEGTPNHFLVNIAPYEVPTITDWMAERNIQRTELFPMVRGRLVSINDQRMTDRASKDETSASDRGRDPIDRELNLTWSSEQPGHNPLSQGLWWPAGDKDFQGVSVESGIAQRIGVQLGDRLGFLIGGERFEVPVTSIRQVDWASMRPNFYMIFSPAVLADYPASYMGSFYLSPAEKAYLPELLAAYPTVTVLEVDVLIGQIQGVIDQVSLALQYIMVLVIAAALLVLFAQTRASFEERRKEMVILRTLGGSGRFIRQTVQLEFLILGVLSGFLAGAMAELSLYLIQTQVLDMQWQAHPWLWLLAALAGGLTVGLAGRVACRPLLSRSALSQIRQLEG